MLRDTPRVVRHLGQVASVSIAAALAAAASLPAVWWEPLHIDEAVTLEFAPQSPPEILRDVFVERGGAPVFFLVEHVSLHWPGGLGGLRLPSFLFLLAALVLSVPVARELGGRHAALLLPPLLAVAPLAVALATFARMYTLLLAGVLLAVWLLLRAARRSERSAWILAGVATGALVYAHPIAPLYGGLALSTAYLHSGLPLRPFLRSAWPGLLALAAVAAPYLYALAVLGRHYGVGSPESSLARSPSDRSVATETLLALTPGARTGAALLLALTIWGFVSVLKVDRRTGAALALWLVVPVAFFSLVPSETAFFARYLLPALPFFLLLVVLGCLAAGRLVPWPLPVAIGLVTAIVAWGAADAVSRLDRLRDLRLPAVVDAVAASGDVALFSSTGTQVAARPGELLDAYVALEVAEAARAEELPDPDPAYAEDIHGEGVAAVREFIDAMRGARHGIWLFSGSPRRLDLASARLKAEPGLRIGRISPELLLVRSREPLHSRALVEQSLLVRAAWLGERGRDRWSRILMAIEEDALARR